MFPVDFELMSPCKIFDAQIPCDGIFNQPLFVSISEQKNLAIFYYKKCPNTRNGGLLQAEFTMHRCRET